MEYIDSEHLILEVQKLPCLYSTKCDDYKNRNLKLESWMNVSKNIVGDKWEEMSNEDKNKCGKEVQKRWKSLKDSFLRALKNQDGRSGSGASKTKPYVFQKQMSFLIPTLQSRTTFGNMDGEAVPEFAKPEESSQVEEQLTCQATRNVREPTPSTQKRKRSGETFERDLLKIMERNVNDSNENDPDRMFLLSLLPSLKQVKQSDKLDVQIKLMQPMKCYTSAPREKPLTQMFPLTNTTQSGTFTFIPSQFPTYSQSLVQPPLNTPSPLAPSISSIESDESVMSFFEL